MTTASSIELLKTQLTQVLDNKDQTLVLKGLQNLLVKYPNHPEILMQLGLFYMQKENWKAALFWYSRLLEKYPKQPAVLCNRGSAYAQMGNFDSALQDFEEALQAEPDYPPALLNKGRALAYLGQTSWEKKLEAIETFKRSLIVGGTDASVLFMLADLLRELNRFEEALQYYDLCLELTPDYATAWNNRGITLRNLEKSDEAIASYDKAIQIQPIYPFAFQNKGNIYFAQGNFEQAIMVYEEALGLEPRLYSAYASLAISLAKLYRLEEALAVCEKALALQPNFVEILNVQGNVLRQLHRFDEAISSIDRALQLNPNYAEGYNDRGVILKETGRCKDALQSFETAMNLVPDYGIAHWNAANMQLLLGDFREGWKNFEWRKITHATQRDKDTSIPQWLGKEDIKGKTILLYSEQGFGDTLQFCRYVPMVSALGARVVLEVEESLAKIIETLPNFKEDNHEKFEPRVDFQCPLISLPFAFQTFSEQDIPAKIPYLFADDEQINFWRGKLENKTKPRIGLVWNGGFRPNKTELWALNARRNIDFKLIAELNHPGFDFYSLQVGEPAQSELLKIKDSYWKTDNFHILANDIHDFSDTAGLIHHLDLIITVDTSVLHLAGAMGKPVWLLNRLDTCWRWGLERENSPWYPSLRIFRQNKPLDWNPVILQVKAALEVFLLQYKHIAG